MRPSTLAADAERRHIRGMPDALPVFARLHRRALVSVAGPDWRSFLQGLITQDVESLAGDELRYGALLTPQGRLLYDLFLVGGADGVLLDVDAHGREGLIQRLSMYRLRAKVSVERAEGGVFALWNTARPGEPWRGDPRLPALGFRAYALEAPALDAVAADEDAFDAHRLALGVPDPPRDCRGDADFPIEANLDLLNGIDFRKGCFVGQETTSRMKRRGQIKSRMVPLAIDGAAPPAGAEVLAGGALRAGEVRSGRAGRVMALLRLDRAREAELTIDGGPARLDPPEWMGLPES